MTGEGDADDPMIEREGSKRGLTIFVVVIALVALAIAAVLAIEAWQSDDDDNLVSIDTTTSPTSAPESTVSATTEPAAATTAPETTVPATTAPAPATTVPQTDLTSDAVWPQADSDVRYDDPVDAARGFAVDFVGFEDPAMGDFQAIDDRSGEVELRAGDTGPVTVVAVSQLSDDGTWWVTGSQTDNIVVESPDPLETVASPLTVSGQARAFEGTVNVALRADGLDDLLVEGFVTGSGGPDLGPFEGTFEFDSPGEGGGNLVLVTYSAENGQVSEAHVTRVFFAAG